MFVDESGPFRVVCISPEIPCGFMNICWCLLMSVPWQFFGRIIITHSDTNVVEYETGLYHWSHILQNKIKRSNDISVMTNYEIVKYNWVNGYIYSDS